MVKKKSVRSEEPTWDEIGKAIGAKMEKGCKDEECMTWNKQMKCHAQNQGCGGAIYGLGFLGALVYYLTTATGFWMGLLGVLKAIVWPAILVYGLLKSVGL